MIHSINQSNHITTTPPSSSFPPSIHRTHTKERERKKVTAPQRVRGRHAHEHVGDVQQRIGLPPLKPRGAEGQVAPEQGEEEEGREEEEEGGFGVGRWRGGVGGGGREGEEAMCVCGVVGCETEGGGGGGVCSVYIYTLSSPP